MIVVCCCPTLTHLILIENASPVYVECADFLSIAIYTLTNISLVDRAGRVSIEGVDSLAILLTLNMIVIWTYSYENLYQTTYMLWNGSSPFT